MGRHEAAIEPAICRAGMIDPRECSHPIGGMEWRRDELASRWVGICTRCGRGKCMRSNYGQEPFVITDDELAHGEFEMPFINLLLNILYEPW